MYLNEKLRDDFIAVRKRTEQLCSPLSNEDYIPQAVEYTSPPKWHLAHTSWFFETMVLVPFMPKYREFDSQFNHLFNSYYQSQGIPFSRKNRGLISRPTVEQVYEYRAHVDKYILRLVKEKKIVKEVADRIVLGLHHEQQHQELLLTDLKFTFHLNPTYPEYQHGFYEGFLPQTSAEPSWVSIPAGIYEVGYQDKEFHFDNETGAHKTIVENFEIATRLLTNEEYLAFIDDGGYQRFNYWFDEGWAWVEQYKKNSPLYWHKKQGNWQHFTLSGMQNLPLQAPVCHLSYYEACAFAHWAGHRLPTEFEWEIASEYFQWGTRWEWTSSAYLPYPKFSISPNAIGEYNGKFMINQMVLRGASSVTSPNHSRKTYRNFFHPHLEWQYSGLRLVKNK